MLYICLFISFNVPRHGDSFGPIIGLIELFNGMRGGRKREGGNEKGGEDLLFDILR